MSRFIPPTYDKTLVSFFQHFSRAYEEFKENLTIEIDESVQQAMTIVENAPTLIALNHPSVEDSFIAGELTKTSDDNFYFLVTRELFRWHPSLRSVLMQHTGCYSILRAGPDAESFKMSRRLLYEGTNKLVVFPEGEISHQNRFLLPLEIGLMYIAVNVAKQLIASGSDKPLFMVPIATLYLYDEDISNELYRLIEANEDALGLNDNGASVSERLHQCFNQMLAGQEKVHGISCDPGALIEHRIHGLSTHLVHEIETTCNLELPEGMDLIDKLHLLKNKFTAKRFCENVEPNESDQAIYHSILRLTNLLGIKERSFASALSQEAAGELLQVLNAEVADAELFKVHRTAFVAAAEPIDVRRMHELYPDEPRKAASALARILTESLEDTLRVLMSEHRSLALLD